MGDSFTDVTPFLLDLVSNFVQGGIASGAIGEAIEGGLKGGFEDRLEVDVRRGDTCDNPIASTRPKRL